MPGVHKGFVVMLQYHVSKIYKFNVEKFFLLMLWCNSKRLQNQDFVALTVIIFVGLYWLLHCEKQLH